MNRDDVLAGELPDNEGPDEDAWHELVRMPDDDTQTLEDVLTVMRDNSLQRQAAFVRWLAEDWYRVKAELQWRDMIAEMPTDLVATLRNPNIVLDRDKEVRCADGRTLHEHLEEWRSAPSNTMSALTPEEQHESYDTWMASEREAQREHLAEWAAAGNNQPPADLDPTLPESQEIQDAEGNWIDPDDPGERRTL